MSQTRNLGNVSRRGFMGSVAGAGIGTMLASSLKAGTGANDTINVGFIGMGGRGSHLLDETLKLADKKVKPVAVCDVYQVRLKAAQAKAQLADAAAYGDFRKLLAQPDLDAVVIASPDHWHAPMALEAIKAGKDVYLEKPFTHTYKEAQQVKDAAEKEKRVVQIGVNSCSESLWRDAYKLIEAGKIGKVLLTTAHHSRNSKAGEWNYDIDKAADPNKNLDWPGFLGSAPKTSWSAERFFRWRKYWDYSGGIASDLFFHQLTHLMVALDGDSPEFPRRVSALGGIYQFWDREVPDTFTVQIDYPSNHTVVLISSMANDVGIVEAIRGHEGTIFFEGDALKLEYQKSVVGERAPVAAKNERKGGAMEHLDNFFACMRDRKKPACDVDLAYKIQVAVDMMVMSFREGQTAYWNRRKEEISCGSVTSPGK